MIGLDWTGLDWTGLDWTGLDWTVCCSLVSYHVLNIEDKVSVARVLRAADRTIGYM